jgi:hypothetical protein
MNTPPPFFCFVASTLIPQLVDRQVQKSQGFVLLEASGNALASHGSYVVPINFHI